MKLLDLYTRVIETTGLDVITISSLKAAISNCMADLTSRGYKIFVEKHMSDCSNVSINGSMMAFDAPADIRKIVYLKLFFPELGGVVANRCNITDKRIQCLYKDGVFRSLLKPNEAIFYVKDNLITIEWDPLHGDIQELSLGYYEKLTAPVIEANESTAAETLATVEINIRKEFEDALVFYTAYFYYSRYVKDTEKIQLYLSNYKYYVEDITHELAYEDCFYEEDAIIKYEE